MSAPADRGVWAAEPLAWAAIAGALLSQNPFGELGPEADRQLWIQALALLGLGAWAVSRLAPPPRMAAPAPAAERGGSVASLGRLGAAALAWGVVALLGALCSVDPVRSLLGAPPRLAGFATELAYVGLFFLWAPRFRERSARSRGDDGLLVAAAALAVYGLVQWSGFDPLRWSQEWQGRPTGAQGNPLFLSQALVWIVPLLASRAVARWRAGRSGEAAAVAALIAVALALAIRTGARGALLGLAAAGAVWGLLVAAGGRREVRPGALARRPLAVGLVVLGVGVALSIGGVVVGADRAGTAGQRALLWGAVGDLFSSAPPARWAVGFGQESLPIVLPSYLPPELPERIWRPDLYHDRAHNAALDALASGGILRLLATLGLFGVALVAAARGARVRDGGAAEDRLASIGALSALVGHAIAMQTGVATAATAALFWWTLARLAGAERESAAGAPPVAPSAPVAPRPDRVFAVQLAQAAALTLFAIWVPAQAGVTNVSERRFALVAALLVVGATLARLLGRRGVLLPAAVATGAFLFGHVLLLRSASHEVHEVIVAFAFAVVALAPIPWAGRALAPSDAKGARTSPGPAPRQSAVRSALAIVLAAAGLVAVASQAASGVALKRGRTALMEGNLAPAVEELERARRLAPYFEDGSVALTRAVLREAERTSDHGAREAAFARAELVLDAGRRWHPRLPLFAIEGAHVAARHAESTAESEVKASRFVRAIELYRAALALDPLNGAGLRGLGAALLEIGELEQAREALALAVRTAPRSIEARLLLARVELARGDVAAARTELTAARAVDAARVRNLLESLARARPRDWTAFRDLALLDLVEGRADRARMAIERAISMAPADALPTLAKLLSESARGPESPR